VAERVAVTFLYALGQRVRVAKTLDPDRLTWRITSQVFLRTPARGDCQYGIVPVHLEADTPAYMAHEEDLTPVEEAD
jgi:hypothetical protein